MAPITIALNKGRILDECLPLLERAGLSPVHSFKDGRRLIFESRESGVRFVVVRSGDVPVFVERGAAEIGVTGKDVLLEHAGIGSYAGYYEWLDLGIGRCRLMTAGKAGESLPAGRLRVATSFPRTARAYFEAASRQVDLIELGGAVELAPLLGLADVIVDIVETGDTLRANGLAPMALIAEITSRVIVNRAAMKMQTARISGLLQRLADAAVAQQAA